MKNKMKIYIIYVEVDYEYFYIIAVKNKFDEITTFIKSYTKKYFPNDKWKIKTFKKINKTDKIVEYWINDRSNSISINIEEWEI